MILEEPETRSPRNLRGYWEYENTFTLLQKLIDEKRLVKIPVKFQILCSRDIPPHKLTEIKQQSNGIFPL